MASDWQVEVDGNHGDEFVILSLDSPLCAVVIYLVRDQLGELVSALAAGTDRLLLGGCSQQPVFHRRDQRAGSSLVIGDADGAGISLTLSDQARADICNRLRASMVGGA